MSAVFDELPVVSALTDEADSPSEGRGIELRIMERELRPGDLGDRGGLCPVPGRDVGGGRESHRPLRWPMRPSWRCLWWSGSERGQDNGGLWQGRMEQATAAVRDYRMIGTACAHSFHGPCPLLGAPPSSGPHVLRRRLVRCAGCAPT